MSDLLRHASGLGEIGLDPKYGSEEIQLELFVKQIELTERHPVPLPICIHSRNAIQRIVEKLSTYSLPKNKVLFHWFAGDESDLSLLQSKGYYVSFGPSIISSNRLCQLVSKTSEDLLLAETDSPISFFSICNGQAISPFAVSSVIFKIAQLIGRTFEDAARITTNNASDYSEAQNSLRVNAQ